MDSASATPGTDARSALLDAVETLCADHNPSDVTMRQIAEHAAVSLGLAYHHFGSKHGLMGASLARIGQEFAEATDMAPEYEGVVPALVDAMAGRPAFARIVAWFILRGDDITVLMGGHPLIARVAERASHEGHDHPRELAAVLALIGLGTSFFGPDVAGAAQLPDGSDGIVELLSAAFGHLAAP